MEGYKFTKEPLNNAYIILVNLNMSVTCTYIIYYVYKSQHETAFHCFNIRLQSQKDIWLLVNINQKAKEERYCKLFNYD